MIRLNITNVRDFMSKLLLKEIFDEMYISEISITTYNTFHIDGKINMSYFTPEEKKSYPLNKYSKWKELKPFCYELIKGNKTPVNMKIIFILSETSTFNLIEECNCGLSENDINGLFLNVNYTEKELYCICGTSLKIFSLDKTLEKSFDCYIKNLFDKENIEYTDS